MCIRDSNNITSAVVDPADKTTVHLAWIQKPVGSIGMEYTCLLYTSDAADERSSVDLGGRRIIKKKKKRQTAAGEDRSHKKHNNKTRVLYTDRTIY